MLTSRSPSPLPSEPFTDMNLDTDFSLGSDDLLDFLNTPPTTPTSNIFQFSFAKTEIPFPHSFVSNENSSISSNSYSTSTSTSSPPTHPLPSPSIPPHSTKKKSVTKVDKATLRKLKNRESANRSYLKKKAESGQTAAEVTALRLENTTLRLRNASLELENRRLQNEIAEVRETGLVLEEFRESELPTRYREVKGSSVVKTIAVGITAVVGSSVCFLDNTVVDDGRGRRLTGKEDGANSMWLLLAILVMVGVYVGAGVVPSGVRNSVRNSGAYGKRVAAMFTNRVAGLFGKGTLPVTKKKS